MVVTDARAYNTEVLITAVKDLIKGILTEGEGSVQLTSSLR
jgi:hypothetical protein